MLMWKMMANHWRRTFSITFYEHKTSALIEASMMAGAVLAGADEEQTSMIEQAASDIGLAFQIQDDILDVTSTSQELGKPVHSVKKTTKLLM